MKSVTSSDILFVTQQFAPEPIGSGPYMSEMASFATNSADTVRVFTCRPFYPDGVVQDGYRNGERDFEEQGNLTVRRVPPFRPAQRGAIGRIISELVFLLRGVLAIATGRLRRSPRVVSLCPSILSVLLGAIAKKRGGRHVVIVHDIQSGLAQGTGMVANDWVVGLMQWAERFALNHADQILVLSDIMRCQLQEIGVTAPIEILPIWVDTEFFSPVHIEPERDPPIILYSGNMGRKQSLVQVLEMARRLEANGTDANIILRGDGSKKEALRAEAERLGLNNVTFMPLVERAALPQALAEADIHLVPQGKDVADFAVPSKIFAIMATGRPFIAAAERNSLLWQLGESAHSHITVEANNGQALAEAVERLIDDPALRHRLGENGRAYVMEHHDRTRVLDRFISHLDLEAGLGTARHTLVFEPDARGHAEEWLRYLMEHASRNKDRLYLSLVIPSSLAEILRTDTPENVSIHALSVHEQQKCTHKNVFVCAMAKWRTMRRYLKRTGASHGIFMCLDQCTFPFGIGLKMRGRKVSGILFRPTAHYAELGDLDISLRERFRDFRKRLLTRLMLANPCIEHVHSLDPYFADFARKQFPAARKVSTLVDPAFPAHKVIGKRDTVAHSLPRNRIKFLLFGEITERKGIFKLLDSLHLLPRDAATKTAIIIAGRIDEAISADVEQAIDDVRKRQNGLQILQYKRFLPDDELASLIRDCDIVLAPYQRFVGSSGVLMWAAQLRRPVISQSYGLVGKLTREYGLGIDIDTTQAQEIARVIAETVTRGGQVRHDRQRMAEFISTRTPERFAAQVLQPTTQPLDKQRQADRSVA